MGGLASASRCVGTSGRLSARPAASHALIAFATGTGLRSNELREARIGDLDLARGCFTVRPETSKFGRKRVIHFHRAVGREIDRYLRNSRFGGSPDLPLFPTRSGGTFDEDGWAKGANQRNSPMRQRDSQS